MKTALFVIAGMLLRDAWCWATAKVWCRHRRRQAQREAKENRELREVAAELGRAGEKRTARMGKVPYPKLICGPLILKAHCDQDFLEITRAIHANFRAQGKPAYDANFEEN
jgi:hypothetical protein